MGFADVDLVAVEFPVGDGLAEERRGDEVAGADARGLLRLHDAVDGEQAEAGEGACAFDAGGVRDGKAEHLHATADADGEAGLGVVLGVFENSFFEAGGAQPEEVVGGLLAAREDEDVGVGDAFGVACEVEGDGGFGAEGVEVGEVGERGERDDDDAQGARGIV